MPNDLRPSSDEVAAALAHGLARDGRKAWHDIMSAIVAGELVDALDAAGFLIICASRRRRAIRNSGKATLRPNRRLWNDDSEAAFPKFDIDRRDEFVVAKIYNGGKSFGRRNTRTR